MKMLEKKMEVLGHFREREQHVNSTEYEMSYVSLAYLVQEQVWGWVNWCW